MTALACGGKVVSAHLGFIGRGRFYWVLPAFDTQYRAWAVGNILLDYLIMSSAESGYTSFDLGEGDYPKLMAWVAGIATRPAVVRALAAVDDVRTKTTQFDRADAGAMDRLFGRGKHTVAA